MKRKFIVLFISILLLSGCKSSNETTVSDSTQTVSDKAETAMPDKSSIQEEIKTNILSNEYPPADIELVLISPSNENIRCSIHSTWSETSSTFLTECYYIISVTKDVMSTHGYSDIHIDISSQSTDDSGQMRKLTYKSDTDISLLDSSGLAMYTYEALNILGPTQEMKSEKSTESSTIASGAYDISGESFQFSDSVRNDSTGNWKISLIASSKDVTDYAIEYYNTLFSSDDEIHAVVNFTLNTTNKISVLYSGTLDITVYEYIDKEEHDANLLFSGTLLKEYWVDVESGEIEKIQ